MSVDETPARLEAVRAEMRRENLDGYLVLGRANSLYVSGFACSSSRVLIAPDDALFFTDFRYIEAARKSIGVLSVRRDTRAKQDLARAIKRLGIKRLGVERSPPYGAALEYAEAFAPAQLIATDAPLQKPRARKSAAEIDRIRQAIRQTDAAYADLALDICEGWSELETRNRLRRLIERHGGFGEAFDSIVASGPNSSRPHAVPGERRLKRGDLVQIDTGMTVDHYCSDLSRVLCAGRPTEKMKRIHRIVLDAQRKAIDAIRAGVSSRKIDSIARGWIEKKGFGRCFGHGLGHGLGLEIHEEPRFNQSSDTILEEGMAMTVEPGIYLPGWGGVRIEDVVAVRADGCEILTAAAKEFAVF